ncbi:response regulator transcription factor [Alteribacter aurantiacus]|uniref:response regulator transcription factor n=1 Tax=Alteribacter aurantiacus TaxID=254410 RepID=UPI00047A2615|nr:response regulator transcription factor [Alteribacter aurantiacus]
MQRILIVDDEVKMQELLIFCLQSNEFEIDKASSGEEAIQMLNLSSYDLVLLDILMSGLSGFDVLNKLQAKHDETPVILLSALGETEQVVKGLNSGAYDYIVKPFEPLELKARIHSVLRRTSSLAMNKHEIKKAGLVLNEADMCVLYQNQEVPLTRKEYRLFARLFTHPGRVYTREQLLYLEWDHIDERDYRNVDAHVKNIREKLKAAGLEDKVIETVWGIGYRTPADIGDLS